MGIWSIIVPEASTNKVKNPSLEAAGNVASFQVSPSASISPSASASISASSSTSPSASTSISPSASASRSPSASASPSGSASPSASASASPSPSAGFTVVTRVTTKARAGLYSLLVTAGSANDGAAFDLEALESAIHYASIYAADVTGTLQASLGKGTFHDMAVIGGATGGWVRYGVQIPASEAAGSTLLIVRNTTDEDFYLDCAQVEAKEYATTYLDGDAGPLFRWTGLRHASSSTRDAQERAGGRKRPFSDYGISAGGDATKNMGMPPLRHNVQPQALLPGSVFQSTKVLPRELELVFQYEGTGADNTAALANLHSLRQDLIDLLKPDLVRGAQPVIIGYTGADSGTEVFAAFHYVSGLEFGPGNRLSWDEEIPVRLFAPDPFWYEDNRETAVLDFQDSLTVTRIIRRVNGQWLGMGAGFNNTVRVIIEDKQRGRIYFGGQFTSAGGVAVNAVCYWDGTTFVAMGSGITGGTALVIEMAVAPNGDVWVGGNFLLAGGATADGLARWNIATSTWTPFANGSPGDIFQALAFDSDGNLYAGGNFTAWAGDGNQAYITKYDGTTFSALGSGMDAAVNDIVYHPDGNIYLGGDFTTGNGVTLNGIGYWNGTTFVAMAGGTGGVGNTNSLAVAADGSLYCTGTFTTIGGVAANRAAKWNGSSFSALGSGLNGAPNRIRIDDEGLIYVGGNFTTAGGLALADRVAIWNGTTWVHIDVDFPGSPGTFAFHFSKGDSYIAFSTAGTALVSGLTTITPTSTAATYPVFTLIGPSSSSCTLQFIENQTTAQRMYFNLSLRAGDTATLSLLPGLKQITSIWRGVIYQQPLSNSDFANWRLLPGANTVAAFVTGTTTDAVLLAHWTPCHWSADGVA